MDETSFFQKMPAMQSIREVTNLQHYRDVPSDWLIAISDVKGSTQAIAAGNYKSVNAVAAATITAMLNSVPKIDLPFLFGGDGATVLVPPQVAEQARAALVSVRRLAQEHFDLELRIGIVSVQEVLKAGYQVKVAKLFVSENFYQPVFTGGGLDYADKLVKDPAWQAQHAIIETGTEKADFDGFECRWSKHPARYEEVMSLLVKATAPSALQNVLIYTDILTRIVEVYGEQAERHPIDIQRMMVSTKPLEYRNELAFKKENVSLWDMFYLFFYALGGYFLWRYKKFWDKYKQVVYASTDHEKFDDMLRMTISGTVKQREELEVFLKARYQAGDLVYGIHTAGHTLMTCLVFDRMGRQVHFLDADLGGYAVAASQMKQQLKTRDALTTQEIRGLIDIDV